MTHPEDNDATEARGFRFPGRFTITAIGDAEAGLPERLPALLVAAGLEVDAGQITQRPSRHGNYLAVRLPLHCNSRDDYERAHQLLRADEFVHSTL